MSRSEAIRRANFTPSVVFGTVAVVVTGCGGAGPASGVPSTGDESATEQVMLTDITEADLPSARLLEPEVVVELPGATELVVGEQTLWVWASNSVTPIDPATNQAGEPIALAFEYGGMVEAEGALWFADFQADALHRYDLATEVWLDDIAVMHHPNRIKLHDGSVWAANGHGRWMSRIDPARGSMLASWSPLDEDPTSAGAPPGAFWGTSADAFQAFAIDTARNELAVEVNLSFMPCAAEAIDDLVWVLPCPDTLLDPQVVVFDASGDAGPPTDIPGWPGRMVVAGEQLWIPLLDADDPDAGATSLMALDRASLTLVDAARLDQPSFDVVVAFDSLWVTTADGVGRFSLDALAGP